LKSNISGRTGCRAHRQTTNMLKKTQKLCLAPKGGPQSSDSQAGICRSIKLFGEHHLPEAYSMTKQDQKIEDRKN